MNMLDHFYLIWVMAMFAAPDQRSKDGVLGVIAVTWVCELVYKTWFM